MNSEMFLWNSKVRDYECDQQRGVNNAVFMNYLEQARHELLKDRLKFNFEELAKEGVGFVILRLEVDFRYSLVSGDNFVIETTIERLSKRRVQFSQNIYRLPERTHVLTCKNISTPINSAGRSEMPDSVEKLLVDYPVPAPT